MIDSSQAATRAAPDLAARIFSSQLDRLLGALLTRAVRCVTSPQLSEEGELACALCDASGQTVLERGGHPVLVGALGATVRSLLADAGARDALKAEEVVLCNYAAPLPMPPVGHAVEISAATPSQGALDRQSYTLVVALPGSGSDATFYLALSARFPRAPFGVSHDPQAYFQPSETAELESELAALPPAVGPRYLPYAQALTSARTAVPPRCEDDEGPALPALVFPEKRLDDLGRRLGLRRGEQNDLVALRAALLHGQRALSALLARWPAAGGLAVALQAQAAVQACALLQALAPGFYAFADSLDDDGCGATDIPLRATLLLGRRDAEPVLSIDLGDSADAVLGPLNLTVAATTAVVKDVVFRLAESHLVSAAGGGSWLPRNDGLLAAISLRLRRGSILAAEPPAALCLGLDETAQRLSEVLTGALAQAAPQLVGSAGAGTRSAIYLSPPPGQPALGNEAGGGSDLRLLLPGGAGAAADGSVAPVGCVEGLGSLEALERRAPVHVVSLARRSESGGLGLRPGQPGWQRELRLVRPAIVTLAGERRRRQPYGLAGGGPGQSGRDLLRRGTVQHTLPAKALLDGQIGDELHNESPSGAGHGDAQRAAFFASLFGESS